MSLQGMVWALEKVSGISATEKLILIVLGNYADADGCCYPSHATMASHAGVSDRTVLSALKSLEEGGLIIRHRRTRPDGSRMSDTISLQTEIFSPGGGENDCATKPKFGAIGGEAVSPLEPRTILSEGTIGLTSFDEQVPEKTKSPNGSRLTEAWEPDQTDINFAAKQGLSEQEARRVAEDFRDYWIARPGAGGRKLDWPATWRTWVRRHCERRGGPGVARGPHAGTGGRSIVGTGEIIARGRGFFEDGA